MDEVFSKVEESCEPMPCMAAIAATAIRAAINPYSMAVAPFLSPASLFMKFVTTILLFKAPDAKGIVLLADQLNLSGERPLKALDECPFFDVDK